MGATSGQYRFDRYWRNIRTFTSMIRLDYKVRCWELGTQRPVADTVLVFVG